MLWGALRGLFRRYGCLYACWCLTAAPSALLPGIVALAAPALYHGWRGQAREAAVIAAKLLAAAMYPMFRCVWVFHSLLWMQGCGRCRVLGAAGFWAMQGSGAPCWKHRLAARARERMAYLLLRLLRPRVHTRRCLAPLQGRLAWHAPGLPLDVKAGVGGWSALPLHPLGLAQCGALMLLSVSLRHPLRFKAQLLCQLTLLAVALQAEAAARRRAADPRQHFFSHAQASYFQVRRGLGGTAGPTGGSRQCTCGSRAAEQAVPRWWLSCAGIAAPSPAAPQNTLLSTTALLCRCCR